MAEKAAATHVTQMATVVVPVSDQDRAVEFFVEYLAFEKFSDFGYGDGERWVEVSPPDAGTRLSLVLPREGRRPGVETGVVFTSEDVEADHEQLRARGVEVDEAIMGEGAPIVYWADAPLSGIPAMFRFRDPDGNSFLMVQGA